MPRIDQELYDEILAYKNAGVENYTQFRGIIANYKNKGGSRSVAYRTLCEIFSEIYDCDDEEIGGMLDVISSHISRGTIVQVGLWLEDVTSFDLGTLDMD